VLGHRGARRRAAENTLAAFQLAIEEGADGVELDVRLDADDEVVVIHDPTLLRVTGGKDARLIEDLTWNELSRVDVGNGEHVPRLADVLSWARDGDTRVNIELKSDVSRRGLLAWKVVRLVAAERNAAERLILSSFDPRLVIATARALPWVPVGYLRERAPVPRRWLAQRGLGAAAVHPSAALTTRDAISGWQRAKLPVNVWTVNEPAEARRLDALGVDCLISDEPGKVLAALGSR
jgi:glycerophosphoryl diester phosphodiesterase